MDFLLWLQSFRSPLLDTFFTVVNITAEDNFITALAVIILWCVDPLVGLRFLLPLLFSGYLNTILKDLFHTPRPTAEQARFIVVPPDGSYAFPSGHTQNAAVLWSYLAGHFKKKPLIVAATIIVPLVGLGRIYRGAHWPVDVLGGIAIGVALVWLALTIYHFWDQRALSLPLWGQLALGVTVPLALFAVYPETSMMTGSALGMVTGFALERCYIRFPVRLSLWKQVLKVLIGMAVLMGLQMGLPLLFPIGPVFRFTRYALVGLWGTLGAPLIFRALFGSDKDEEK
ncbi:MAG: phosphatase PAP2 family protein [Chloroflexota bacterium]|nr:phosphatase PAP2 family protein [Chloroflexota bacterium]